MDNLEHDELDAYDGQVKERMRQLKKVWHDERRAKEAALREQQEAVRIVQALYEENKRIATEHPLIDDTGKGEGVRSVTTESGQGLVAQRFAILHTGSAAAVAKDPEKQKLLKQKEDIESKIDDLKYRKAALSIQDYRQQLQKLLVDLAKTQEALDK